MKQIITIVQNDGTVENIESNEALETVDAATLYTYDIKRKEKYPAIEEQLDKLYHDMTAGKLDATGEWHKAIKAVKDKYPKE